MNNVLILEADEHCRDEFVLAVMGAFPLCHITIAGSVREGVAAALQPIDLALIDIGLPDGSGFVVLRQVRSLQPDAICVVIGLIGDDSEIVAALAAGADGYLMKGQSVEQLHRQLLLLQDGQPALSPAIARRIMEHFRLTGPAAQCDASLSEREKQVLSLISRGLRNSEAARTLGIAECTVATHIKSIYRKLGISSRAEASWHAARFGL